MPVISEIELGARLLANPIVGVTGTNGKTTTTALLGAVLEAAAWPVEVAGNIGRPLSGLVGAVDDGVWIVCELSSFQLEDVDTLRPRVVVLTNLEPDHIDRHGSFDAYAAAKLRAFARQGPGDVAVVPRGFGAVPGSARRMEFSADDPLPAEPRILGAHNRENAAAATAAALAIGVPDEAIAHALETFPGVEHRIEEVATVDGVLYVNDSKATNAGRRAPRARVVSGQAEARHPRGAREGRALRRARGGVRGGRPRVSHRRGSRAARCGIGRRSRPVRAAGDARTGRRERGLRCVCGGRRAPVSGVRVVRPVRELRAARGGVQEARAEAPGVGNKRGADRGQVEQRLLILITLGLVAFGLVMVFSATSASATLGEGDPMRFLIKQGLYAVVGLVLLAVLSRLDYHVLRPLAPLMLVVAFGLCAAVLAAPTINGAHRWFLFGPVSVQPAELAKLAVCVWVCAVLARRPVPRTLGDLAKPVGLVVAIFCALIVVEPDLGTTIALAVMVSGILLVSGIPLRLYALATTLALGAGVLAIYMEPYRRARLLSFIDPWKDAEGAGFQNVQAIIGMGSGGITGEGLGQGIQKVNFLPEAHTDMIFAVVGEELGLIGSALLIGGFAVFAWVGFRVALECRDPFGKRLAAGITTLVCGQAAVNLAAVLGIAPLTGIPLPFVSYGGSSLLVMLAGVGVLLNIAVNERVVEARVRDRGRGNGRARSSGTRSRGGSARPRSDRDVRRDARPRRVAAGA